MPNTITLHPCASTQIQSHGYDPESQTLAIVFHRGGEYHYHDVPEQTYRDFVASSSKGSWHHKNIRDKFRFTKIG